MHDVSRLFDGDYYDCASPTNVGPAIDALNTTMTTMPPTIANFSNVANLTEPLGELSCRKDRPILAVFLMLITFWLANKLSTLNQTSLLTRRCRELVSDYSLPIAILFFSLIANTVFQVRFNMWDLHSDLDFKLNKFGSNCFPALKRNLIDSFSIPLTHRKRPKMNFSSAVRSRSSSPTWLHSLPDEC